MANRSLEELGWRQFSICLAKDIPELCDTKGVCLENLVVVLPYSCAVVNEDFDDAEPSCEVIIGRKADQQDKALQHGRNPRRLQIEIEHISANVPVNFHMKNRHFIDHKALMQIGPRSGYQVPDNQAVTLKHWIAQRYLRSTFPDNFNERAGGALEGIQDRLKKMARKHDFMEHVRGIYLRIDSPTDELDDLDDPYDIEEVVILVSEHGFQIHQSEIEGIREMIDDRLSNIPGIAVTGVKIVRETKLTYSEFKELQRVDDYDFISFENDQEPPVTN